MQFSRVVYREVGPLKLVFLGCFWTTKKQWNYPLFFCNQLIYSCCVFDEGLILILVEEEVFFGGVVGPYVFDGLVDFAFLFEFLEVFYHFHRGSAADGVVDEFVLCCGPGGVFELGGQFQCPVHIVGDFGVLWVMFVMERWGRDGLCLFFLARKSTEKFWNSGYFWGKKCTGGGKRGLKVVDDVVLVVDFGACECYAEAMEVEGEGGGWAGL